MHFLPLSLLLTFSTHNFSVPISTPIFLENKANSLSIVQFQDQYLTKFASFSPVFDHSSKVKTKIEIFEAKKTTKKTINFQKSKKVNFARENLNKLSNFLPIYIKESSELKPISNQISQGLDQVISQVNFVQNQILEYSQNSDKNSNNPNQNNPLSNTQKIGPFSNYVSNYEKETAQNKDLSLVKLEENESNFEPNLSETSDHENKAMEITELSNQNLSKVRIQKILPKIAKQIIPPITKPITKPIAKPIAKPTLIPDALPILNPDNLVDYKNEQQNELISSIKEKLTQTNLQNQEEQQLKAPKVLENLLENQENLEIKPPIQLPIKNQTESSHAEVNSDKTEQKTSIPIPIPAPAPKITNEPNLNQMIIEKCQKYGCDANKMLKVVKCESGGRNITGTWGHIGPFQFTSRTFYSFATKYGVANANIWNVSHQVEVATQMFANGLGKQHWSCF